LTLIAEWKAYVEDVKPDALMFSTSAGTPILPNNVVRRASGWSFLEQRG